MRHLYVHLPFCSSRCGYCDFVTVVGREGSTRRTSTAILAELDAERHTLADRVSTVFVGGGTPTFTDAGVAATRCCGRFRRPRELTVEANPETVTPELAALLREEGVSRVSLGAQTFAPGLLERPRSRCRSGRHPARGAHSA